MVKEFSETLIGKIFVEGARSRYGVL